MTLHQLLQERAAAHPAAAALHALDRTCCTFVDLLGLVRSVGAQLRGAGVKRADAVAIVLPNGPEAAAAFLAAACVATAAPLNPAYREGEFDFYLADLNAKVILVPSGDDGPAVAAARKRGVRVLRVAIDGTQPAGCFTLQDIIAAPSPWSEPCDPDDVALVLHTSGTTSRPKMVPLTHRNLCASAQHIRASLQLTAADRCLNIMPLFHIHGLIAALLSSLCAGASVACMPGFIAPDFLDWLATMKPTWYTAVPTMHQAIAARAAAQPEVASRANLRFIRSSSSALPPQVMAQVESVFGCPMIEAYGMTEASHQMCSNPLPPLVRKPGSVGVASGPRVAISNDNGEMLLANQIGEVAIQGPNVTEGYVANASANAEAFRGGWFRTGDQGYLDDQGYLYLTGRLKELINRGGEKIAPREIDESLLDHPAVAQAVAFAMKHPTLGEDIAAAVVLKPGAFAIEAELRRFAAGKLADFKVPRKIVIVDAIPKGATGKLQRIGLAEKLGVVADDAPVTRSAYIAPATPTEQALAHVWKQVLGAADVGREDHFFQLGGDSIQAARVATLVATTLNLELPMVAFFETPVLREMAAAMAWQSTSLSHEEQLLAEIETLSDEQARAQLAHARAADNQA